MSLLLLDPCILLVCKLAGGGADPAAREAARQLILPHSPTGKVPALLDRDLNVTVCESLAILYHLHDTVPGSSLFPANPVARALCHSVCAEMHAGFVALRTHCGMHVLATARVAGAAAFARADVQADVQRLQELFDSMLVQFGGPYLCGAEPSAADAMFAPVALRFRTYDPDGVHGVKGPALAWVRRMAAHPSVIEWIESAKREGPAMKIPHYETMHDPPLQ